jgi:Lrp/AsnC family transcriptional regulator, regulator for asnA, asnC and gidA
MVKFNPTYFDFRKRTEMGKTHTETHSGNNNVLRLGTNPELPEHKTAVELDDLDRALIEIQQEDPFFSYNDMAETWGVTTATIRNRIKRLKTSGVIDVVTVINPYKVGFETFAMIGVKLKADASPEMFVEALGEIEGVSGITMVAGSFDFFVTYVCRNMEEYRRFITEQLRGIPEIELFESFIGLELYERKFLVGLIS